MNFLQKIKSQNHILIPILLMFIGFVIYANCFPNQMFWDDDDFILKNRYIKDWSYLPKYFTENVVAGNYLLSNYWRPMLMIVFSIEWHLWKDWAPGYHIVSTFIHSLDSVLLYFLLFGLFKKQYLALLTSLVFLVHPLQTEAVVYANALSDSLASFFVFLSLIFYQKFKTTSLKTNPKIKIGCYSLCLCMYPLGLMSKETAFILPAYIFLAELFVFNSLDGFLKGEKIASGDNLKRFSRRWRKVYTFLYCKKKAITMTFLSILPFLLIALGYLYLRATSLNFVNTFNFYNEQNILTSNFLVRLFTFFRVMTIYTGLLFFPIDLHVERNVPIETSLFSGPVLLGASICLGLVILAWRKYKETPLISFGVLWFFIGIFPSSNLLVPINALLYEHFLYLPLIGIFLIIIHQGFSLSKKSQYQRTILKLFLIFLLFFSIRTIIRNLDWRDSVIFYENLLKYAPKSYRVINNLGMMYADRKLFPKAEETYKRAILLDPSNPVGYHNLAGTYRDTGKTDLAIENFEKALQLDQKFLFSYKSLAQIYLKENDLTRTKQILEQYLIYTPDKLETLFLLSQIARKQKDLTSARFYIKKALSLDPHNTSFQKNLKEVEELLLYRPW